MFVSAIMFSIIELMKKYIEKSEPYINKAMWVAISISLLLGFILLLITFIKYRTGPGKIKEGTPIALYFNNFEKSDECSNVYPVYRSVNSSLDSITPEFILKQLFAGPSELEIADGFSSQFNDSNNLIWAREKNGILYVNFSESIKQINSLNSSCGIGSFLSQVTSTIRPFSDIRDIRFAINSNPADFYEWMQLGCQTDFCDETPFKEL